MFWPFIFGLTCYLLVGISVGAILWRTWQNEMRRRKWSEDIRGYSLAFRILFPLTAASGKNHFPGTSIYYLRFDWPAVSEMDKADYLLAASVGWPVNLIWSIGFNLYWLVTLPCNKKRARPTAETS